MKRILFFAGILFLSSLSFASVNADGFSAAATADTEKAAANPAETETVFSADAAGTGRETAEANALSVPEAGGNAATKSDAATDAITYAEYIPLDIDYPDHPLVLKYHNEFNSEFGKKWLAGVMERAKPYRPYIRRMLKENDMPLCLEYLPVIESNYNCRAVSKSGAAGLWQFMENSIKGLLKKNEWVDERMDPWLSTDAALKKLRDNYNYYKDWGLALAAYNMGLGGLNRIIKNSGKSTVWELIDGGFLRTETKNYFPKFLAIADLITNADYYQLDLPPYEEDAGYDFVTLTIFLQVNLDQFAAESGISYDTIKTLNPALLYPVTPYNSEYKLRIPADKREEAENALAKLKVYSADIYTVKKGDTLWGISRRYGITVDELCNANNITGKEILRIGTMLFVPIVK